MTWDVRQLTDWYSRLADFDKEMYAYFLEACKHLRGIPQEEQSLEAANHAAACTIKNRRMRESRERLTAPLTPNGEQYPCPAESPSVARPTTEDTGSGHSSDMEVSA